MEEEEEEKEQVEGEQEEEQEQRRSQAADNEEPRALNGQTVIRHLVTPRCSSRLH